MTSGEPRRLPDPLEKFIDLNALHDRNEALFFRVVSDHFDEMVLLIYTLRSGSRAGRSALSFRASALGVIARRARRVTDEMFFAAARTLPSDNEVRPWHKALVSRQRSQMIGAAFAHFGVANTLTGVNDYPPGRRTISSPTRPRG